MPNFSLFRSLNAQGVRCRASRFLAALPPASMSALSRWRGWSGCCARSPISARDGRLGIVQLGQPAVDRAHEFHLHVQARSIGTSLRRSHSLCSRLLLSNRITIDQNPVLTPRRQSRASGEIRFRGSSRPIETNFRGLSLTQTGSPVVSQFELVVAERLRRCRGFGSHDCPMSARTWQ